MTIGADYNEDRSTETRAFSSGCDKLHYLFISDVEVYTYEMIDNHPDLPVRANLATFLSNQH